MNLRHYGKFRHEEVVILGYKASMNHVMICRLGMLPVDDQVSLRQIASSVYAQDNCDYLIPVLQTERHKSGHDWFTYLVSRLQRNDGSVSTIPIKEIEDMNHDQKAFFKGYGTSINDAKSVVESNETAGVGHAVMGEDRFTKQLGQPVPATEDPVMLGIDSEQIQVETPEFQTEIKSSLESLASSQEIIAKSLAGMSEVLTKIQENTDQPKPSPKKTVTRKKASSSTKSATRTSPRKNAASAAKTDTKKSVGVTAQQ